MAKTYEIRDPVYGFIQLNDWERDIINHDVFQRLRRIKQLGFTDMVYPGAMHTRFSHSLGVMHVATKIYDGIVDRREEFLKNELAFTKDGLGRDRVLVRLACLLHDIGHAPFSHASESLMVVNETTKKPYKHENYSAAVIVHLLKDVIEGHPINQNYKLKAQDIADFINGETSVGRSLLWRELVSGQLDADRADYLLRDSHHIGVKYGHYDLDRLLVTMTVAIDPETDSPTLAVEQGGDHTAEALIVARYMMFTQVYFQHTRRAYDHHSAMAMKELFQQYRDKDFFKDGYFPPPDTKENVQEYVNWDDWKVYGLIRENNGGENSRVLLNRNHHRRAYETPEIPSADDLRSVESVAEKLGEMVSFIDKAESSWYKFDETDIPILLNQGKKRECFSRLSRLSSVVRGLRAVNQIRIYTPYAVRNDARKIVKKLFGENGEK